MALAGLFPWQATNLASKWCLGWDLALLKKPPPPPVPLLLLPGAVSAQHQSLARCLPLPVPVGMAPWAVSCCRGTSWLLLAATLKQLADSHSMVLAPGGTLDGRRSGGPKHRAAAAFPASSLPARASRGLVYCPATMR